MVRVVVHDCRLNYGTKAQAFLGLLLLVPAAAVLVVLAVFRVSVQELIVIEKVLGDLPLVLLLLGQGEFADPHGLQGKEGR